MKDTKPSATALFVANGMYHNIYNKKLQGEISESTITYCTKLIDHIYELESTSSNRWHLFKIGISQLFSIKGFYLHFLVRKKCIEDHLLNALREGYEQVIVLGAGYDTLCSRLAPNLPEITFIEIDHPATSAQKISLFRELKWGSPNLRYISFDLKNAEGLFSTSSIDKQLKTIFICEGVMMYLEQKHVQRILESIKKQFTSSSKFIFTFMEERKPGNYMFKNPNLFLKLYLRIKNEPFTWGIKPKELKKFMADQGWKLQEIMDHDKLRSTYLRKENQHLPIAIGELIAIGEIQKK